MVNDINSALAVSLSAADVEALRKSGRSLDKIAEDLLRDAANGGVVIRSEWAARIEAAIGRTDAPSIIEAVERSVDREGDATLVEWRVDPTQVSFYQSQADNAGMSLRMLLKAHMDLAYSQGWLGQTAPDAFKLLLTQGQYQRLQQLFGRDVVTGEDVFDRLMELAMPAFAQEEDEALVLDALKRGA